jgi:prophage antirepressor-like protein
VKNQIRQFHSREFGSLEILMVNDKPYFPAAECASLLGYRNPRKAVLDHCDEDGVTNRDAIDRLGRKQEKKYISEGNLYRLIIRSKLPAAKRFERWVFDEVLPAIRKHGAYATHDTLDAMLRDPKFAEALIRKLAAEQEKSAALERLSDELAPKALYCDLILQSKNVMPVSLIAKDYSMSAVAFNNLLHGLGIQFRMAGTWLLYQGYAGKGYTQTRTYQVGEKTTAVHTCWTQKGRLFLYEFLKAWGILPLIEKRENIH